MKYIISIIVFIGLISSCEQKSNADNKVNKGNESQNIQKELDETTSNFPVIGFKKIHEKTIPFPIEKVFPLFEPQGRHLLYDNWKPTTLKEGKEGSLIGRIEFSKYNDLDVLLKVTKHNPNKGHIQYLAVWDDFEIQRIDIFCKKGIDKNTTELKWVEHNSGLYEKGVSLVNKFVLEGHLEEAVERYSNNIEMQLNNER